MHETCVSNHFLHFFRPLAACEPCHLRIDAGSPRRTRTTPNRQPGEHVPITADAREMQADLARFRHELHREPEIGLDAAPHPGEGAQGPGRARLRDHPGQGHDVGHRGPARPGRPEPATGSRPAVLLRADMDGLPVQEKTGVDYTSRIDGAMHACGHDLHTSMLAGAATLLAERRHRLAGDVVLMFQPGEEGFDGASHMIREGVLDAAGPARGRRLRHARVFRPGTARDVLHQARRHAQLLRRPGRHRARRRRPRVGPARGQGPGDGRPPKWSPPCRSWSPASSTCSIP